uniref:GIR1-like zinc ribbon domain-containing protein n=1 Tax=Rhizophora mucronata TaxID=61149 RepID=A0A2P2PIP4_RHIMU
MASLNIDKKHYAHDIGGGKVSHPALKFLEESCLELNLVLSAPGHCHSVCTLDKVKSALLREEKESCKRKRSSPSSPSSSHASPSSNDKQEQEELDHGVDGDDQQQNKKKENMHAAGCPGCLMYVMTFKTNPKCPRCNSTIPSPLFSKKPRFDLNASL